jgi:hypothetical protein
VSLTISDDLYAAIQAAAAPIAPSERPQFLAELAAELEHCPVLGPGVVHRCTSALQRKHMVEAKSMALHG